MSRGEPMSRPIRVTTTSPAQRSLLDCSPLRTLVATLDDPQRNPAPSLVYRPAVTVVIGKIGTIVKVFQVARLTT